MESAPRSETLMGTSEAESDPPPFGSRYLTDESLVFEQNAWDHVPPPEDQEERIQAALDRQRKSPVPEDKKAKYNSRPSLYWDIFYRNNQANFFKDRKWLQREFPQLEAVTYADAGPKTVFEVGCGAGNVVFPLLSANNNPHLRIVACDFSKHAIRVVKSNPLYSNPPLGSVHASIWDLSSQTIPEGLEPESVDIVVMIFVLSALHPSEWAQAVANVYTVLKPGGVIVFRDYGRHDLTQLRFKEGRLLEDNFYIRGDGTRVYFFEASELGRLFTGTEIEIKEDGLQLRMLKIIQQDESTSEPPQEDRTEANELPALEALSLGSQSVGEAGQEIPQAGEAVSLDVSPTKPITAGEPETEPQSSAPLTSEPLSPSSSSGGGEAIPLKASLHPSALPPHPLFTVTQLGIDRRLLVNRKKQLRMYRVWLQGEIKKNKIQPKQSTSES